jgi:hypothetical protein
MGRVENGGTRNAQEKDKHCLFEEGSGTLKPSSQLAEILGSPAPISRPQVEEGVGLHQKA